jgi:hypothetical protein
MQDDTMWGAMKKHEFCLHNWQLILLPEQTDLARGCHTTGLLIQTRISFHTRSRANFSMLNTWWFRLKKPSMQIVFDLFAN